MLDIYYDLMRYVAPKLRGKLTYMDESQIAWDYSVDDDIEFYDYEGSCEEGVGFLSIEETLYDAYEQDLEHIKNRLIDLEKQDEITLTEPQRNLTSMFFRLQY